MLNGRKLSLALTVIAVLALAFAVSCRGFFTNPTLSSIVVSPAAPQVNVNQTVQMEAFGTYDDGSRKQISSGVSWSVSQSGNTTIATIGATSGVLTGVTPGGPVTVTAEAQGLSGTASATVLGNVTAMTVSPTSATVTISGSPVAFTFAASPGPPSFVTADNGGTLTITPSDSFFTCSVGTDGSGNPAEVCSATQGAASSYTLQMTYGTVVSPTASVTVQ